MRINKTVVGKIINHALRDFPIEACGYLAGKNNNIIEIYPMKNADQTQTHYSFDVQEQFAVLKEARKKGLELKAVYHSHPHTPARMSVEDIRLAYDPDIIHLIYSVKDNDLKAFKIEDNKRVIDIELEV